MATSKVDASLPPLPTSTSTFSSASLLPRPLAHVVLLLIDGVGDVPCKAFVQKKERKQKQDQSEGGNKNNRNDDGGLTPLQAAAPLSALDAVASAGLLGLLDPVQPGQACGSDTAHLSLLGYNPRT